MLSGMSCRSLEGAEIRRIVIFLRTAQSNGYKKLLPCNNYKGSHNPDGVISRACNLRIEERSGERAISLIGEVCIRWHQPPA